MEYEVSQDDVSELVKYLENIKTYEKQQQISESSTISMIWGLFIIVAGLTDLNLAIQTGFSPHVIPWFSCIIAAYVAQQLISSQPLLFDQFDDTNIDRMTASTIELILTAILMLMTFPIGLYDTNLVMPYIGISFGSANLYYYLQSPRKDIGNFLIIIGFFLSSIIILFLGYGINDNLFKYGGLLFGLIVGPLTFLNGMMLRQTASDFINADK